MKLQLNQKSSSLYQNKYLTHTSRNLELQILNLELNKLSINKSKGHPKLEAPIIKNQKNFFRQFFKNFDKHCKVQHEVITHTRKKVNRKLEDELLTILQKKQNQDHQHDFSFKKPQSHIEQTDQSKQTEATREQTQKKQSRYFLNNNSNQRLRKFNSLIVLKKQSSINSSKNEDKKIFIRRNRSLIRSNFSRVSSESHTNRSDQQQNTVKGISLTKSIQYSNVLPIVRGLKSSRVHDEQKERLNKIRKQLNEIYMLKKNNKQKLRLD